MAVKIRHLVTAVALSGFALSAQADDVEGVIESINVDSQTFSVQGIEFEVDDRTDYDDGLRSFEGLQEGMRVEVDYDYQDGRHIVREIEVDD